MRVAIIGGGVAGISTATKLRRLDENVEIVIFEKSDEFAVSNCALPYYLSGEISDAAELEGTSTAEMKNRYNIDVRLNSEVENINPEDKTLKIINRDTEHYDKLVIAIGAYQLRPDINGVLSEKVFTIRNIASINKIKDFIAYNEVKRIVIVGGGFIGVEMAESFNKLGIKVSIVEASDHVIPALDYDMATAINNQLRERGIRLYLNQQVKSFEEKEVRLSTGSEIKYDMALIATGVGPEVKLPILANLEIGEGGGLKVDEHLRTSNKDIYAAGDTIEVTNLITRKPMLISHAGLAIKEAKVVAENLAGKNSKFYPVVNTSITPVFDYTAGTAGCNEQTLQKNKIDYHKIHVWSSSHASFFPDSAQILFKLLFSKDGKILGVEGVGAHGIDKRIDVISEVIKKGGSTQDLEEAEIAYSPAYSAASDTVNHLGSLAQSVVSGFLKPVYYEDIRWDEHQEDYMIIDVRGQEQFQQGHIPNAINIPITAIRGNLDSIPHDKKVILYCNRGYAAYNAYCILVNRGFDNIYFLSGGFNLYNEIEQDQENSH